MKSIGLVVQRCFPLPHLSFIHTLSIQTLTSLPPSLEMKSNLITHAILLKQIIMYPTAKISCPRRTNRAFSYEVFTQSPQSFPDLPSTFFWGTHSLNQIQFLCCSEAHVKLLISKDSNYCKYVPWFPPNWINNEGPGRNYHTLGLVSIMEAEPHNLSLIEGRLSFSWQECKDSFFLLFFFILSSIHP